MLLDPNTEAQKNCFHEILFYLSKEEEMKALKVCPSPLIRPIVRYESYSKSLGYFIRIITVFYYLGKTLNLYSRKNHICAPSVKLFRKQVPLPPQEIEQVGASLEQFGIKGGTRLSPMEVTILYQTQCSVNLPRTSLFVNSINDCYLLWDEAALWLEDVEPKSPGVPSEKSRSTGESVTLMGSASGSESDSSSVDSLTTFFTVEEGAKRRAKRMRNLVRRCEQRMRDLEGAHSPPPSTTSSSVSRRTNL
ncbi:unnamed protein product [Taenia asiatica]|uniref:BHLH domain-containing protein n=1 Tax=Taenia asiatica TaxID=60517 RepID=A0A0R3W3I4_TAEAS|nr:unnamed protein product [Taenia asiatica]